MAMEWELERVKGEATSSGETLGGEMLGGDTPNYASRTESIKRKVHAQVESLRMLELELENLRLTRLVAELLLKNQKLRELN